MARVQTIFTSFAAGELTPRFNGRPDFAKYHVGCRTLANFVPLPLGAADKRPGTRFVNEVKDSSKRTALMRFEFSTTQAYQIEFGHLYCRFYKDDGRIESPPGTPVEIVSPYAESDLFDAKNHSRLKFNQSADTLYLWHPTTAPRKLTRTSHTSWTLTQVTFLDGPYLAENVDAAKTLTPSATSGAGITITAVGHAPFVATDAAAGAGRLVRIKHGATWGYARIVGFTSSTVVTADVVIAFGAATASAAWRLGAWSATTGYPACGTFHEERLFAAGAASSPQRFDGSKSGSFEDFTPGIADGDAIAVTIGADDVANILWLSSDRVLLIGAVSGEYVAGADSQTAPLTPTNIQVKRQSTYGSAGLAPVRAADAALYLQRQGRKLRAAQFSFEHDHYISPDLTRLAEHLTRGGIVALAYQQEPWGVVWAARADGVLLGLTYLPEEEVVAWHRHTLGDGGVVESVSVIPGNGADELWLIVRRTVSGLTKRYVERMVEPFADDAAQADAFYVDCGLTYSGAPATTIAGLSHLEGKTVSILADGAVHPAQTVSGGQITLTKAASRVHAGLGYTATLKTMPLDAGALAGTAQGRVKRIDELTLRLYRALGGKVGRDEAHLDDVLYRDSSMPMDQPPALTTGDKKQGFAGTYDTDGAVVVVHDQPLPFTLLAIIVRLAVNEG